MAVLCLRNEPFDTLGLAPTLLEKGGFTVQILDAFEPGVSWPSLESISGLVVFGGAMNADETGEHPHLMKVRGLLAEALDRDIPMLGICLGAQLLARAAGARVFRAPVRELGFKRVFPTAHARDDPMLSGIAAGTHVFQWHEDTVELPEEATLLATGADVRVQAYRIGRHAWGLQFHPEVDRAEIEGWITESGTGFERVWGRTAPSLLAEIDTHLPRQLRVAADLFGRFAGQVRARDQAPTSL